MSFGRPYFSIVIPTHARPGPLKQCIRALTRLEYPRDRFEVIVVDDASAESPEAVIAESRDGLDVTFIRSPQRRGPAAARNTGVSRARGEWLAFTDDDCAPAPDWLTRLADRIRSAPNCLIGGRTVNQLTGNAYAAASQLLISYLYDYYNNSPGGARFFTSNNMTVYAEAFRTLGGFDAEYLRAAAEDREFCDRWLQRGYRMIYAPEALVYHAHMLDLHSFWRQHFNYGRGAFHFHGVRARRNAKPIRVEPLSFYLDLLRYPFRHMGGSRSALVTGLIALSQGANAAGFYYEMLRQMWPARAKQQPV